MAPRLLGRDPKTNNQRRTKLDKIVSIIKKGQSWVAWLVAAGAALALFLQDNPIPKEDVPVDPAPSAEVAE